MEYKFILSYKEEQSGMVASAPAFIYKWIKNFDGAEIELSDTSQNNYKKLTSLDFTNIENRTEELLFIYHSSI